MEDTTSTITIAAVSAVLIALIGITALLINQREEEISIAEDDELPDDVWAKRDESTSDEVLAAMAGLQMAESKEWSDEDLLDAGWTQEQIDIYREEKHTQNTVDDINEEE